MSETIGVIGLGRMGGVIASHLLDAGFEVVGHDVLDERRDELVAHGGTAVGSAREVGERAGRVVTSLPSADALDQALTGDDGLLACGRTPLVVIEVSTLGLADKQRARAAAADAGATLLDCPVSGTAAQARSKDIAVYASGDREALEDCRGVFEAFARSHVLLGEFGAGSQMKYLANHLVVVHTVAAAEAMVLGMKAGLDPQQVLDVITSGAGTSRMFEIRGPSMVRGEYEPAMMSNAMFDKDIAIIDEFAHGVQCPLPLFDVSRELHAAAIAEGLGDADLAAVCSVLERMADDPCGRIQDPHQEQA